MHVLAEAPAQHATSTIAPQARLHASASSASTYFQLPTDGLGFRVNLKTIPKDPQTLDWAAGAGQKRPRSQVDHQLQKL